MVQIARVVCYLRRADLINGKERGFRIEKWDGPGGQVQMVDFNGIQEMTKYANKI